MIIIVMFVDREKELSKLLEISESKKAELILIYGRRRVGKSRLLVEFKNRMKKTKNSLYFLADTSKNILDILSSQIKDEFVKFTTWEDFFDFICRSKYEIIIIDEFQYLYQVNKAWPTMLQRWWEKIKETNKKIILCGSIISTIYKISKGYGSALYGRKTYEMQITPLKFKSIKNFLKHYNFENLIKAYAIVGGIPRYLEEFDSNLDVEENIRKKIVDKNAFLYNEPTNLLFEEFRDPTQYISIILAITQGYTKFNEIATMSKIEGHKLPKYLLVLERINIIEKEVSVTEKKIKTKTTRYNIKDNFYRFWFRFIFRNKSMIELGLENEVFSTIKKELNSYIGRRFEDLCKESFVPAEIFTFTKVGRWWHKDKEIDIVALNEKTKQILFGECKWKSNANAKKILSELREKSKYVDWNNEKRKEYFVIFAKSFKNKKKFEKETKKRKENVFLFDLKDIEKLLKH